MNDESRKLIEALAAKLGVTAEHLWEVLVRQALISGATDLVIVCVITFMAWRLIVVTKRKTTPPPGSTNYPLPAEWGQEAWIPVGIIGLLATVCVAVITSSIVPAFLNPEYWALMRIIK